MRILFLVCSVTAHDDKFIQSLSASGYTTRIFSFHARRVSEALASLPNISLTAVPLRIAPRVQRFLPMHLLPRLKATIREFKPDIIHSGNTWNESFLGALSGFHPLLVMPYGSDVLLDSQRNPWFKFANKFVFRHADWVTCDAEYVKAKIMRDFRFPTDRISVIPWGIDVESIARERDAVRGRTRQELGWEDKFIVIMTRNHESVYGIDVFLKAMATVVHEHPDVRVVMVGGGPLSDQMKQLASRLGLDHFIRWFGRVPRPVLLRQLYGADLYVSSSYSDGTSVSLLEAMASSLSVVLTDVPSNLEWITPGVNGEIAPRGDSTVLAKLIGDLASDNPRNTRYGQANLKVVRERGDWPKDFGMLEDLYHRIMRGGTRAS
jgi:L-malate glycosyltransferase